VSRATATRRLLRQAGHGNLTAARYWATKIVTTVSQAVGTRISSTLNKRDQAAPLGGRTPTASRLVVGILPPSERLAARTKTRQPACDRLTRSASEVQSHAPTVSAHVGSLCVDHTTPAPSAIAGSQNRNPKEGPTNPYADTRLSMHDHVSGDRHALATRRLDRQAHPQR
jgi:hypothetical protein